MIGPDFIPGSILGLREGLEAFLIVGIILDYLGKLGRHDLKRPVRIGLAAGIGGSLIVGLVLHLVLRALGGSANTTGKLWEAVASLAGLVLLTGFISWMMRHGRNIVREVRGDVDARLSGGGLFALTLVVVLREGVEIALFAFSSVDKQAYIIGIAVGIVVAAVLAVLISRSLVRVNLGVLFTVTLAYLVLQAGYLLGYAVHELLSALKAMEILATDHGLLIKAFDFGGTILDHKGGAIGVPLNVLLGWYSRPEWLPFLLHVGFVAGMFLHWYRLKRRDAVPAEENKNRESA